MHNELDRKEIAFIIDILNLVNNFPIKDKRSEERIRSIIIKLRQKLVVASNVE